MRIAAVSPSRIVVADANTSGVAGFIEPITPTHVENLIAGLATPITRTGTVHATLIAADWTDWIPPAWEIGPAGETGWRSMWQHASVAPDGRARVVHVWDASVRTALDDLMGAAGGVVQEDGSIDLENAVRRAAWWFRAVGHPYHGTPGLSALDVMRRTLARTRDGETRTPVAQVARPDRVPSTGELVWAAPRRGRVGAARSQARAAGQVHQWDMRAAYLAAAGAAELGWGEPTQTGADPEMGAPGWYRVRVSRDARTVAGVPVVEATNVGRDGTCWVTEPIVRWWNETGHPVEVIDSWTSKTSGRLLRPWAEQWRDIIASRDAAAGLNGVLKLAYVQAIGLLGRSGGRLFRADWHDTIRATARVSMLRRIARVHKATGLTPFRVNTDAAYYVAHTSEMIDQMSENLGVGGRMGNMRYVGVSLDA